MLIYIGTYSSRCPSIDSSIYLSIIIVKRERASDRDRDIETETETDRDRETEIEKVAEFSPSDRLDEYGAARR